MAHIKCNIVTRLAERYMGRGYIPQQNKKQWNICIWFSHVHLKYSLQILLKSNWASTFLVSWFKTHCHHSCSYVLLLHFSVLGKNCINAHCTKKASISQCIENMYVSATGSSCVYVMDCNVCVCVCVFVSVCICLCCNAYGRKQTLYQPWR